MSRFWRSPAVRRFRLLVSSGEHAGRRVAGGRALPTPSGRASNCNGEGRLSRRICLSLSIASGRLGAGSAPWTAVHLLVHGGRCRNPSARSSSLVTRDSAVLLCVRAFASRCPHRWCSSRRRRRRPPHRPHRRVVGPCPPATGEAARAQCEQVGAHGGGSSQGGDGKHKGELTGQLQAQAQKQVAQDKRKCRDWDEGESVKAPAGGGMASPLRNRGKDGRFGQPSSRVWSFSPRSSGSCRQRSWRSSRTMQVQG